MITDDRTPLALQAPLARLMAVLVLAAAGITSGFSLGSALLSGASPSTSTRTLTADLAGDETLECATAHRADDRQRRARWTDRRWRRRGGAAQLAAMRVRRAIGRWRQSPPAWRGPPILLI